MFLLLLFDWRWAIETSELTAKRRKRPHSCRFTHC